MKDTIFKRHLWKRLVADANELDLDYRINERPADRYAQLAGSGKREEVVRSLRSLLVQVIAGDTENDHAQNVRFLRNALPLCDSLAAIECRPILKTILLLDDPDPWKDDLPDIQRLAARALVGLRKDSHDLRFWKDVAQKLGSCLPYALNAAVEIDIAEGIGLVCEMCLSCQQEKKTHLVDWATIFHLATERYGVGDTEQALHRVCSAFSKGDELQEFFAVSVAQNPELSHRRKRDLQDIVAPVFDQNETGATRQSRDMRVAIGKDTSILDLPKDSASAVYPDSTKPKRGALAEAASMYGTVGAENDMNGWLNYNLRDVQQ